MISGIVAYGAAFCVGIKVRTLLTAESDIKIQKITGVHRIEKYTLFGHLTFLKQDPCSRQGISTPLARRADNLQIEYVRL